MRYDFKDPIHINLNGKDIPIKGVDAKDVEATIGDPPGSEANPFFGRCEHIDLDGMTDEELKARRVLQGRTDHHGFVKIIYCDDCYERTLEKITAVRQISISCEVKE